MCFLNLFYLFFPGIAASLFLGPGIFFGVSVFTGSGLGLFLYMWKLAASVEKLLRIRIFLAAKRNQFG